MQLANNARTILASGINNSTQTIPLSDATLFPTVTATVLTGTVTSTGGNAFSVTGSGTLFTSELAVGDVVTWTGIEWRRVVQIVSNTVMILDRETTVSGVTMTKRDAYYITVSNASGATIERMLVLATSGNTFTCARAQDSSSAAAFDAGAAVEYRVTAGFVRQIIADAVVSALKNLAETHGADLIGLSATGVTATVVSDALEEVAASVAGHVADSSAAHAASAISFTPASTIAATDVQAAVVEALADANSVTGAHVADAIGAHAATAISFSPAGALSSTEVQAAIEEAAALVSGVAGALDQIADIVDTTNVGAYDNSVPEQVSRAIGEYVAGADYWTCSGSGTTFALAAPGGDNLLRKPTAYFDGMQVRFFASADTGGAASLNVAGIGPIQVLDMLTGAYASWREDELVVLTYLAGDFYKPAQEDGAVLWTHTVTTPGVTAVTIPAGFSQNDTLLLQVWGGGGSGAAQTGAYTCGGGGGGGFSQRTVRYSDAEGVVTDITCGAGGAAIDGVYGNGNNGAASIAYVTGIVTAYASGGQGGQYGTPPTSAVGGVAVMSITLDQPWYAGGQGDDGTDNAAAAMYGAGGGGGAAAGSYEGAAGTSEYGGLGGAGGFSTNNGVDGTQPGGGGGGHYGATGVGVASGAGGDGKVVLTIIRGWHPVFLSPAY